MHKEFRLFEIIWILRLTKKPVMAAMIAELLEMTVRSVYPDIVALQVKRVPIEGGRSIGCTVGPGSLGPAYPARVS